MEHVIKAGIAHLGNHIMNIDLMADLVVLATVMAVEDDVMSQ